MYTCEMPVCLFVCLSVRYVLGRGDAAKETGSLDRKEGVGAGGGAMERNDFFDGMLG